MIQLNADIFYSIYKARSSFFIHSRRNLQTRTNEIPLTFTFHFFSLQSTLISYLICKYDYSCYLIILT